MPDSRLTDTDHLRTSAYRDPGRLNARATLHERFGTNPQRWFDWVFEQLEIAPDGKILEVGCGPGSLWAENIARIPSGWKPFLSDLSLGMVKAARKSLTGSNFKFAAADASALSFETESFDALVANHMLYHVADREQAFSEFTRVLRPGGRFYAATNGVDHMQELVGLLRDFNPLFPYEGLNLSFTLESGERQLSHWFEHIVRRDYPDALEVTEAELLAAYIASMTFFDKDDFDENELASYLQSIINRQGSIHMTKSTGLFIARKA